MEENDHHSSHSEKHGLTGERNPKAAVFVCQRATRTIYFHQRDDTEEEIYNPNDRIALKEVLDFIHVLQ